MSADFPLGQTVMTRNAMDTLDGPSVHKAMARHSAGDWGNLCEEDRSQNEKGLEHGGRLFSSYQDSKGVKFWIITEADRSVTTVLLPEDY